ncbi:MAG: hypothetical protein ACOYNP_18855 [Gemmataceae bacterium]
MQVTGYVIECADDALTFEFDSVYGDRVVYVSNKPGNLDTDVFFKYTGIPLQIPPGDTDAGWAKSFGFNLCS